MADFQVKDGEFQLNSLSVSLSEPGSSKEGLDEVVPAPVIGGCTAMKSDEGDFNFFEYCYDDMGMLIPFTGGLLLADGFIENLYVHQGYHPAWKFKTVHELIFEKGHLVSESDVSGKIAEIRSKMEKERLRPEISESMDGYMDWIKECFSLDYGW